MQFYEVLALYLCSHICIVLMMMPLVFESNKLDENSSKEHKALLALQRLELEKSWFFLLPTFIIVIFFLGSSLFDLGGVYTQFVGIAILSIWSYRTLKIDSGPKDFLIEGGFPKEYFELLSKRSKRLRLGLFVSWIVFIIVWVIFSTFRLTEPAVFNIY